MLMSLMLRLLKQAESPRLRSLQTQRPASRSSLLPTVFAFCALSLVCTDLQAADAPRRRVVTFTDLPSAAGDFWNGSDGSNGFTSRDVHFNTAYNSDWGSWAGIAYSRVSNTNTAGYDNQSAVWMPGTGIGGTGTYAVVYDDGAWGNSDVITFPQASTVHGFYINNTTYAARSMLEGDDFAKKFGGENGKDPDWFKLTITGRNAAGDVTGSVEFYLADYRFDESAQDYIVSDWTWVDLASLGQSVTTLEFLLSSSDSSAWGVNTPTYFAMDNLEYTPQPSLPTVSFDDLALTSAAFWNGADGSGGFTNHGLFFATDYTAAYDSWSGIAYSRVCDTNTEGYLNQYAVWMPGTGVGTTGNYAIVYDASGYSGNAPVITLPTPSHVQGFYINNTTYAALSMLKGDWIAKKFGGATGNDPDWFKLTVTGKDAAGITRGTIECYLADYRFSDNHMDYILQGWTWLDLSGLGNTVKTLSFTLSSSDTGAWGMNTPAYFALDHLQYIPQAHIATAHLDGLALEPDTAWQGEDGSGGFTDHTVHFNNTYTDWGGGAFSWSGFAYSRINDTVTAGYANQYAVYTPGKDVSTTGNYAVAYDGGEWGAPVITLQHPATIYGFYVNNTTYAARSMLAGDWAAKKFGGATGLDPDWFKLTITAKNSAGLVLGKREVYLADFQFTDPRDDYILNDWTWVDLSSFGKAVKTLHFSLSSSDVGEWGINTPTYFALDNLIFKTTSRGTVILIP